MKLLSTVFLIAFSSTLALAQSNIVSSTLNPVTLDPTVGPQAYDLTVDSIPAGSSLNPNGLSTFCKRIAVETTAAHKGQCSVPLKSINSNLDVIDVTIVPGTPYKNSQIGASELPALANVIQRATGMPLESIVPTYCNARIVGLDCSLLCSGGRKEGEEWTEVISGSAFTKKICLSGGRIEDKEIYCDASRKAGDMWIEDIANGKLTKSCSSSGSIIPSLSCNGGFTSNNGISCEPAPCGSVASGERGNVIPQENGSTNYMCDRGAWIDPQVNCNAGTIKENNACRLPRACSGNLAHNAFTVDVYPNVCNASCSQDVTTSQCSDGALKFISKTNRSCTPRKVRCA